jgi:predicted RNA binding protein YcfA (HicA-like mRNA interferase family)
MPKLPVLTPKKLIKKLNKLGFEKDHTTGSHYIMLNSQTGRRAVVPFHLRDIPKGTLNSLLKEAGIARDEISKV